MREIDCLHGRCTNDLKTVLSYSSEDKRFCCLFEMAQLPNCAKKGIYNFSFGIDFQLPQFGNYLFKNRIKCPLQLLLFTFDGYCKDEYMSFIGIQLRSCAHLFKDLICTEARGNCVVNEKSSKKLATERSQTPQALQASTKIFCRGQSFWDWKLRISISVWFWKWNDIME